MANLPSVDYAALAATMMPNTGYLLVEKLVTTVNSLNWYYNSSCQPPWISGTTEKINVVTLILANFLQGYGSYLVWRDRGGLKGAAVPLTAFAAQIMLFWIHLTVSFGFQSIKWSLYATILTVIAALVAIVLFCQVSIQAGLLIAPYVAYLTHQCARDYWRYTHLVICFLTNSGNESSVTYETYETVDKQSARGTSCIKRRPTGYVSPHQKAKTAAAKGLSEEGSSRKLVQKEHSLPYVQDTSTTKHPAKVPTEGHQGSKLVTIKESEPGTPPEKNTSHEPGENLKTGKHEDIGTHHSSSRQKSK